MTLFFVLTALLGCMDSGEQADKKRENDASSQMARSFPEPGIPFAPRSYVCYRVESPLTIDGKLNESAWQKAEWTAYFVDIQGFSRPQPRFKTRAKMLWDDGYFYVAARLEEPDVWANLKKRDSVIFYDNDFEVFIDPDGDTHRYYELEINAFGTEWDLFLDRPYRDDCRALFFWDIGGLKTGITVDGSINRPGDRDRGWSLEIALPWDVLKECAPQGRPPRAGEQWRVNFSRVEWKTEVKEGKYVKVVDPNTNKPFPEDNWVWSPQGLINMHYPEMWGFVQFSNIKVGQGKESFQMEPEEKAKFSLRQVYYRERGYFKDHGHFTDNIALLGLDNIKLEGYTWPPKIQCTWNLFEARLESLDGKEVWMICQNGRVWRNPF